MLDEVLRVSALQPGQIAVDCTVGWAGHSAALLERVGLDGLLIGLDLDAENLPKAQERLALVGPSFHLVHGNFASLPTVLAELQYSRSHLPGGTLDEATLEVPPGRRDLLVDFILADLGMDRSRGRTAAQILQTISEEDLVKALRELADEPLAETIASAIVKQRHALERTSDLAYIISEATSQTNWQLHPSAGRWNLHPAARTFQALRILVNREISNLEQLVRIAPQVLRPGGCLAIISFHSGEDRVVKSAFRAGKAAGIYSEISPEPLRASEKERASNPRARSAKMRWARKA
jgi:16S rRNA (cytosine1402-N4)-methyltransferase